MLSFSVYTKMFSRGTLNTSSEWSNRNGLNYERIQISLIWGRHTRRLK
jgi:hypothetical protein